ncbi:MAG: molybdopterin-guanine dinucleotide biosynthesis protein B [Gemmatimonadaceae bacterium]
MPNASRRPPLFTIVGRKNAGKTTLVVRLAAALRRRGHRVMTIKHGTHTFNIDPSTTDTYRHYHEGEAERVAMVAPDKFALVMRLGGAMSAEDIAERFMSDADIVICEGFKASTLPRIEIHRRSVHAEPLYLADSERAPYYRAIVTDDVSLVASIPVIALDAIDCIDRVMALVEREIMGR